MSGLLIRKKKKLPPTKNRIKLDQRSINTYLDAIPYKYRLQVIRAYNKRFLWGATQDHKGDWWELESSRQNANEYLKAAAFKAHQLRGNHAH